MSRPEDLLPWRSTAPKTTKDLTGLAHPAVPHEETAPYVSTAQRVLAYMKMLKEHSIGSPEKLLSGEQSQVDTPFGQLTYPSGAPDAAMMLPMFGGMGEAAGDAARPFFSALRRTIESKMPRAAMAGDVLNLAKQGAKADEIGWTGLEDFLAGKGKVTKEDVLRHLDEHAPVLTERMLDNSTPKELDTSGWKAMRSNDVGDGPGDYKVYNERGEYIGTEAVHPNIENPEQAAIGYASERNGDWAGPIKPKFSQYTLPGGENHRELVITMPPKVGKSDDMFHQWLGNKTVGDVLDNIDPEVGQTIISQGHKPEDQMTREVYDKLPSYVKADMQKDWVRARSEFTPEELAEGGVGQGQEVEHFISHLNSHLDVAGLEALNSAQLGALRGHDLSEFDGVVEQMHRFGINVNDDLLAKARNASISSPAYHVPAGHAYGDPELDVNRLMHMRFTDRPTPEGGKGLMMEELQSDWHQAGRKEGYGGAPGSLEPPPGFEVRRATHEDADTWKEAGYGDSDYPKVGDWILTEADNMGNETAVLANAPNHLTREQAMQELHGQLADDEMWPTPSGVPDAPFKNTWHELGVKRALDEAARGGYDRLMWTTGRQQADRYSLAKYFSKIEWDPKTEMLTAYNRTGEPTVTQVIKKAKLPEYMGQELADKLTASTTTRSMQFWPDTAIRSLSRKDRIARIERHRAEIEEALGHPLTHTLEDLSDGDLAKVLRAPREQSTLHSVEGKDLMVGGSGMVGFYDRMLPKYVEKYSKKWGVKPEKVDMTGSTKGWADPVAATDPRTWTVKGSIVHNAKGDVLYCAPSPAAAQDFIDKTLSEMEKRQVWSIKITPQMRQDLVGKGQPLFEGIPPVPPAMLKRDDKRKTTRNLMARATRGQ